MEGRLQFSLHFSAKKICSEKAFCNAQHTEPHPCLAPPNRIRPAALKIIIPIPPPLPLKTAKPAHLSPSPSHIPNTCKRSGVCSILHTPLPFIFKVTTSLALVSSFRLSALTGNLIIGQSILGSVNCDSSASFQFS